MIECRKYLLHTKRDDVAMSASALNTNKTLNSIQAMRGIVARSHTKRRSKAPSVDYAFDGFGQS